MEILHKKGEFLDIENENDWKKEENLRSKLKRRKVYSAFVNESTHLARFRKLPLYLSFNLDSWRIEIHMTNFL